MQRHAEEGARIIDRLGFLNDAVPAIRHHHERFDGTGYPDRLHGEDIPLGARIIHVADALDSMLTTRIYRAARPAAEALQELRRAAGTQFCPRCVTRPGADPAAREPPERRGQGAALARSLLAPSQALQALTCVLSRTLYPSWHGPQTALQGGREDRPRRACLVPGRNPQALLERSDPGGATCVCRAARPLADDARVRGRPGHGRSPADGHRALRQLERCETRGRPRSATLRHAGGTGRPPPRTGGGPRSRADRQGSRRATRVDALEVALLAHLRFARRGSP